MKNIGFTLVEMLVLLAMLLLLIGISIPACTRVAVTDHTSESRSIINQLDTAVKMYWMDFSTTPNSPGGDPNGLPVSNYNDRVNTWYGCQSIVLALTGYYYQDNSGNITYGANPSNGFGWKTTGRNSPIYGPYNDTDKLKFTPGGAGGYTTTNKSVHVSVAIDKPLNGGGNTKTYKLINDVDPNAIADSGAKTSHHAFLDAFGKVILYYSTNNAARAYACRPQGDLADNFCADGIHDHDVFGAAYTAGVYYAREDVYWSKPVPTGPGLTETQSGVYSNLTPMFAPPPSAYYKNASGTPYRSDFMLLSWGGDSQWYGAGGSIEDDANNLYGK